MKPSKLNPNFAEAYKERGRAKLLNGDKDGSGRGHEEIFGIESERGSWSERIKKMGPKPGGTAGNLFKNKTESLSLYSVELSETTVDISLIS